MSLCAQAVSPFPVSAGDLHVKLGDKQVVSGGSDGQEGGKADFFLSRKDCYKKKN